MVAGEKTSLFQTIGPAKTCRHLASRPLSLHGAEPHSRTHYEEIPDPPQAQLDVTQRELRISWVAHRSNDRCPGTVDGARRLCRETQATPRVALDPQSITEVPAPLRQ